MDDLRPEPTEGRAELPIGLRVRRRPDGADEFGHQLDLHPLPLGPAEEVALGPLGRAGDERHVVAVAVVQALDREQRVLLRPAEDQAGDDVGDAHGRVVRGRRAAALRHLTSA